MRDRRIGGREYGLCPGERRLSREPAHDYATREVSPDLRRSHDRFSCGVWRRAGEIRNYSRPDHVRQNYRRRASRRCLWWPGRHHEPGLAARADVSGGHVIRESPGHGCRNRDAEKIAGEEIRNLPTARITFRKAGRGSCRRGESIERTGAIQPRRFNVHLVLHLGARHRLGFGFQVRHQGLRQVLSRHARCRNLPPALAV